MYYILFIFLLLALYLYFTFKYINDPDKNLPFWTITFLFLFAMRFKSLVGGPTNQDEDQWMISANSMLSSFQIWSKHFACYDIERLYTIVPLAILSPVLKMSSICSAHLLAILFSFGIIYITFRINKLIFSHEGAVAAASFFVVVFALAKYYDIISYNSEYPAVTLLVITIYLLITYVKFDKYKISKRVFLIGFITSLVPFAKEQAVILAFLLALISMFQFLSTRKWKHFFAWALGGISGLLLSLSPLIVARKFGDLIFQMQIIRNYQKTSLHPHDAENGLLFKIMKMLPKYWLQADLFQIFPLAIFGLVICFAWLARNRSQSLTQSKIYIFYILIFVCSVFTVYAPGNYFYHYFIFLLPPAIFFAASFFNFLYNRPAKLLGGTFLIALFLMQWIVIHNKFVWKMNVAMSNAIGDQYIDGPTILESMYNFKLNDRVDELLAEYSSKDAHAIFWGWDNSKFLKYNLKRCSRYLYPVFAMNNYSGSNRVKQIYMDELLYFKPSIIVELVGTDRFYFTSPEFEIRNMFPQLQQQLDEKYRLVEAGDDFKFYVRK